MISKFTRNIIKSVIFLSLIFNSSFLKAQNDTIAKSKNIFWQKVKFGGGIGLGFGNGYTNIALSPTMYYNINEKVSVGLGLNGSLIESNNEYKSWIYGGSAIMLFNPIENIQISSELEQLRVNTKYQTIFGNVKDNFWNTALFLGAGYRLGGVTLGLRYNVLHDKNNFIYSDPWMPFVRVIF